MRLPAPKESAVQKSILRYLTLRGALPVRVNSGAAKADDRFVRFNGSPGCSDILACYRGRFLALEVKRDGKGKPTDLQSSFIGEVVRAGGVALVVWEVGQVARLLDEIDESQDD